MHYIQAGIHPNLWFVNNFFFHTLADFVIKMVGRA